ncbi:hypothetical protein BDD43_0812 [Mucilaginibacter gracilis]|uniref:Uncharacterized protein n=1 Tax=Mucilaginibacter gracilis TaxID=423350 RepID=A0A495IVD7_9SPHI|nr:hypothetical protein [Mucilaginibacter gracilis]RKR80680.1 hypothetical protein BDD43_0812 [Mucilaginibacter gracilis]
MNMLRFLKSRKNQRDKSADNGLPGPLAPFYRKAADYLNGKTAGWSQQRKKIMLILFCLFMGNLSLFIAGHAILSANGPPDLRPLRMVRPLVVPGGTDSIKNQIINQKKQHNETDK